MVKEQEVKSAYEVAKERYAEIGVDTEKAIEQLSKVKLSIHSWQGDDIHGFLNPDQELTGGIGVSGNYPGIARTPDELTQDLHEGLSLIPGKHKIQLHTLYAVTDRKKDFDEVGPEDFKYWVDWAKEEGVGLDMNGTFFSHPKVKHNFTLASPDKDNPIDKLSPRKRLIESLDEIIKEKYDEKNTIEAFEGKLFGTGIESYTVGSHLFYNNYAITRDKLWTIDAGHWHPTEDVSDNFSAFMPFGKGLMLHVSRPVRWDSDHVVIFDDALVRITRSLVRDDLLSKTNIGLDFFDATINRVAAWVIGARSTQKALLQAMLAPIDDLKKAENEYDFTKRLAVTEELKSFPFGAVWDEFCQRNNVPVGLDWMDEIRRYEKDVQFKRN